MASFAVTWDASAFGRLDAAEATTNWSNDGATPTQEPDFFYQGSNCISCQVKTSEVGQYCAPGSADMSTTARVWIVKLIQTNYGAIDGNGLSLRIGSSTSAYYPYVGVFTASTYPVAGGWQILLIDPNVSQWRGTPTGSPNLAAVNYWAIRSDASATAKAPNLGMDAIDIMNVGTGLTGVGGDGASTDGTFEDFRSTDEGNSSNRWGIILSVKGILYVNGVLTIGSSGAATEFTDSNVVVVFPDHRVTTGTVGLDFDIQNASTAISIAASIFNGRGALYTSDDTRPDYTVTGTSGALTILGSTFNVFRQIDFTSGCTINDCSFLNGLLVNAGQADLTGCIFEGCTGAADSSYLTWDSSDPDGSLDDCSFTKGSTATHAISFGASIPTTITLRGIDFSGYNASDSQNDSTLYFADTAGTTITLNLVGCTGNISIKTNGCTVNKVINPVTTTVTVKDVNSKANIQNARVIAVAKDATGDLPFEISVTSITRSVSTATVTTGSAHGLSTGDYALIEGANEEEYNGCFQVTVTDTTHFTYTVPGTPSSPATGTIICTGAYFNSLTNASGVVTDTRSITNDQPLVGWVRKGSSSPFYKTSPLDFTVDSANGVSVPVFLIPDE